MSTEAPKREAGARTFSSRTDLPAIHEAWLPREHSLHRPRHGGRQLVSLICAAVFFATPLVALTLGVRPAEFENRRLIPFPSPGAGWDFLTGLDPWASDHLVFRDAAVHAADGISRGLFGEPPPFDQHSPRTGPIGVNPRPETPVDIAVPPVIEGKEGWMYLGDDVVTRCRPANSLDFVIGQLRRLRDGV
ncbi:MAG TPA: hypothetical protein VFO68_29310, partial [Actinophytocola sp.]|nr:hypothetical protein [Actinophytocola sp.]